MDRFLNAIKAHTGAQDALGGQPRFGVVTSVDAEAGTARVELQPDGVLTGWLPVASPWVGAGWGMSCPPSPGDQVVVVPQEGDAEHGVVVARAWSAKARAPGTPVGELWLTHRSGSYLRLLNDGTVSVRGDLRVEGEVFDRRGSLDGLRQVYNRHRHPDPQGGVSGSPEPLDKADVTAGITQISSAAKARLDYCIKRCQALALPTSDFGATHYKCLNTCTGLNPSAEWLKFF